MFRFNKATLFLALLAIVVLAAPVFGQQHLEKLRQAYETLYQETSPGIVAVTQKNNPRAVHPSTGHGVGSGVIISEQGHILTALSNITKESKHFSVTHINGKIYEAEIINKDPFNAIALLKINNAEGHKFQHLTMGDSDRAAVGSVIMTLTNNFGSLTQSASVSYSTGVLSGRYPINGEGNYYGEVLETDAAVNPGGYGGAVINSKGQLLGLIINSFSYDRWLGTAVPINQIKDEIEELIDARNVFTPAAVGFFVDNAGDKVLIEYVTPLSPAAKAGLQAKWQILRLNGRLVENAESFLNHISKMPGATRISLQVQTDDGSVKLFSIKLPKPPPIRIPSKPGHVRVRQKGSLGVVVTTELGRFGGARVKTLEALGAGAKAGLEVGDIIYSVQNVPVTSSSALSGVISQLPAGMELTLHIYRKGSSITMRVRLRGKIT
ncbi:trypsin-like peptidase domain-containing protein [Planctomycetota bacterium]